MLKHTEIESEDDWAQVFEDDNPRMKLYKQEIILDIMSNRQPRNVFLLRGTKLNQIQNEENGEAQGSDQRNTRARRLNESYMER